MNKRRLYSICTLFFALHAFAPAQDLMYYTFSEDEAAEKAAAAAANVPADKAIMSSSSRIDWSKQHFSSDVSLNVVKAGIPMPSGKSSSLNLIQKELPVLVKDTLLSIYVDDTRTLGDLVLDGTITLDELTRIIDNSQQTPASFKNGSDELLTRHTLRLQEIGSLLVKHHTPYTQQKPIQRIASRAYTGIVIDARNVLPVQGEFVESYVQPCLFPKIWDDQMTLVYERNMVDPETAKKQGIVTYMASRDTKGYTERAGKDPLWITAKKVYGVYRCDPVISHSDYLRIATIPENLQLLKEGKVVILLNKDQLSHAVSAPTRDKSYYIEFNQLRKYFFDSKLPGASIKDIDGVGAQITVQDLRFIADSAQLLPEELPRIEQIANQIQRFVASGGYTIVVEGHTADVNKPEGQQRLSVQRAQSIVEALVDHGIDRNLLTYRGFGGTKPVASNSTAEGRAQNRRVEIIIMPKANFTQRR